MKKLIKILALCIVVTLLSSNVVVFAHVVISENTIGALLHIDPEDDPIIGKPATFYFEIKDKNKLFKPNECECTATILKDNEAIFLAPLFQDTSDFSSPLFSYTFQEKGTYVLIIKGTPKIGAVLKPFTLRYDLRVQRMDIPEKSESFFSVHIVHALLLGGVFAWACIVTFLKRR